MKFCKDCAHYVEVEVSHNPTTYMHRCAYGYRLHKSVVTGIEYCPLCGQAVCPECGSHDVVQVSRVTGYLQDVSGWNAGKQQELKDRMRYSVA